jgi:hypothetical protein
MTKKSWHFRFLPHRLKHALIHLNGYVTVPLLEHIDGSTSQQDGLAKFYEDRFMLLFIPITRHNLQLDSVDSPLFDYIL